VRTVAERSKARGQMLVRLIAAQKKVDTAKEAVEAAKVGEGLARRNAKVKSRYLPTHSEFMHESPWR
jgi:hypothetical protein